MSDKITISPRIRIAGITDAWEQCKASEIFKVVSVKNCPELPVLSASQELGMIRRDEIGIDIKYDEKSIKTYKRVKPGQFVIHLRSFQGGFAWSDIEGITSPAYTILDFKVKEKHHPKFWKEVLTSRNFIKKLETVTYGIRDGRSISFTDFSTLNFLVPPFEEQQRISRFFNQLDNLITLYQRKLELLKEMKKRLLQKMFPKDGADVPEIRFAGFTDAWEQRMLGEIGEFKNGMNFGKEAMGDGHPFVNLQDIFGRNVVDDSNLGLAESSENQRNEYCLNKGDVLFIRSSVKPEGVGETALVPRDFPDTTYSGFIIRFRPNVQMADEFKRFAFSTKHIRNQIMASATSSANTNINQESLQKIKLKLPDNEEQEKVGAFFANLDHLITLHQRELNSLKNLKKSLLQQMFI